QADMGCGDRGRYVPLPSHHAHRHIDRARHDPDRSHDILGTDVLRDHGWIAGRDRVDVDLPSGAVHCLVSGEAACALADAIAGSARLFNCAGRLIWLRENRLVQVDTNALREIITEHLVNPRLVNRGTASTSPMSRPRKRFAGAPYRSRTSADGAAGAGEQLARASSEGVSQAT